MKQLFIIISMFFVGMVSAQSKYEAAMMRGFEQMKSAKTAEDMAATSAFFERVADAEKDKWLPYYYAAQTIYFTGWMNPKADKDKVVKRWPRSYLKNPWSYMPLSNRLHHFILIGVNLMPRKCWQPVSNKLKL